MESLYLLSNWLLSGPYSRNQGTTSWESIPHNHQRKWIHYATTRFLTQNYSDSNINLLKIQNPDGHTKHQMEKQGNHSKPKCQLHKNLTLSWYFSCFLIFEPQTVITTLKTSFSTVFLPFSQQPNRKN